MSLVLELQVMDTESKLRTNYYLEARCIVTLSGLSHLALSGALRRSTRDPQLNKIINKQLVHDWRERAQLAGDVQKSEQKSPLSNGSEMT